MSKWSHLPNARHIARVLESLRAAPNKWGDAWISGMSGWNPVFGAAFDEARNTGRHDEWSEVTDAAWGVAHHWPAQDEIYYSASSALVALVAYDNCAYLLDEQPDHVQLLAGLGVAGALLLYPACIVLSTEKVPYVKMVPSS